MEEKVGKVILGMKVNPNTTKANILGMFLVTGGNTMALGYYNEMLVFLLRGEDFYNIRSSSEVSRINSEIIFYSLITSTALAIFMGQMFDIFGRRSLLVINFFILALLVGSCPYMAPDLYCLAANRMGVAITTHFIFANPCIPDYIRPESRGFAVGLMCLALFLGQTIGTTVIAQITQDWDTKLSFVFVELLTIVVAVLVYMTIREPDNTDNELKKVDSDKLEIRIDEEIHEP